MRQNRIVAESSEPLTYEGLAALLEHEGFPADRYCIGHRGRQPDQVFVADRWSSRWVVYYTERGGKFDIRKHETEDAACRDLLARLRGT